MAKMDPATILQEPKTFYLEGIKTKYEKIVISGLESNYLTMSVTVPFAKSLRALRGKTVGQVWFGNKLFLLAEGELVQKQVATSPTGPAATLVFYGVSGNMAALKYAAVPVAAGTVVPAASSTMANLAAFMVVNGASVGGTITIDPGAAPGVASKGSTINADIFGAIFDAGLTSGSALDMAKAFREMAKKFLYADATKPETGGIFARGSATTALSAVDQRFRLIDSIIGVTDQELIDAFYGAPKNLDGINPFLDMILNQNQTGENSVMEIFRSLASRAFHNISEMVAPPFSRDSDGNPALGRLLVVPRLFSADPPVCNVFFSRMCTMATSNVTALKTTRLVISQNFPLFNLSPLSNLFLTPPELALPAIEGDSKSFKPFVSTTQEESEVGVMSQNMTDIYGAALPLSEDDMLVTLSKWFARTNALRFLDVRTEGQQSLVAMEFNPFVAIGFPGLFIDPFMGVGRGFVKGVTHTITPTLSSTTVAMDHCLFADAMEYTAPFADIETGFDGALPGYSNAKVSEIYEKALGCKSLTAAAADLFPNTPLAGKSLAEVAQHVSDRLSSASENDKTDIYKFIMRSVASYGDLLAYYQPGVENAPSEIPNRLDLGKLYVDQNGFLGLDSAGLPENQITTIDIQPLDSGGEPINMPYVGPAPKTEDAIQGGGQAKLEKYQIADRVSAVIAYVNDIG